jgi:hypothetical protein
VTSEGVDNLVFTLAPPRQVSGRIVFDSASVRPPEPGAVQLRTSGSGSCRAGEAKVKDDLTFTMRLGGYRCWLAPSARNWYVRSVMSGNRDVTIEGLALDGAAPLDDLVVTFTDRTAKLSATVTDASGQPASEFVVVVFPADRSRWPKSQHTWEQRNRSTRVEGPGRTGEASFTSLFAGDYLVVAVSPDDADPSPEREWLEQLESLAQRLTLTEGEARTMALKLVDVPDTLLTVR